VLCIQIGAPWTQTQSQPLIPDLARATLALMAHECKMGAEEGSGMRSELWAAIPGWQAQEAALGRGASSAASMSDLAVQRVSGSA